MKKRLIFVRHGEAEGNVERRFHGHYDSSLTENGQRQVRLLAERLREVPIDCIYSSDLQRALGTAMEIAKVKGLDIKLEQDLREINGGRWEDVPWDDLPVVYSESYQNWLERPHKLEMPDGETMVAFQDRLIAAVERIAANEERENILIATHGTAIKVLICHYKGRDLCDLPELPWHDNASITIVDVVDGKYSVEVEGDNSHLGEHSTLGKQTWWIKE